MPKLKPLLVPLALMLGIAMALSACGRKGDLDQAGAYEGQTMDKATGTVKTKPVVREDKPFILDPLL